VDVYLPSFPNSFLNLGSVKFMAGSLAMGEKHRQELYRRLGGPQSRSGRFGDEKSHAPAGIQTPDRPARSHYINYLITASSNLLQRKKTTSRPPCKALGSAHHSLLPTALDRPHDACSLSRLSRTVKFKARMCSVIVKSKCPSRAMMC
jgi:hypothetical protein